MNNMYEQALNLGCDIELEEVLEIKNGDIKTVVTDESEYKSKAVIVATGCKNRLLGLPKEEDFIGNGISFCVACDGAFYKDRDVVVIGGGNTALEDAVYLSEICKTVYLVHRRDEFRAEPELVNRLNQCNNVIKFMNTVPKAILGTELVESITLTDVVDNTDTTIVNMCRDAIEHLVSINISANK